MLNEMLLDSWNVGLHLRPFSTGIWAAWLRQFLPHFLSLYRKVFHLCIFQVDCYGDYGPEPEPEVDDSPHVVIELAIGNILLAAPKGTWGQRLMVFGLHVFDAYKHIFSTQTYHY